MPSSFFISARYQHILPWEVESAEAPEYIRNSRALRSFTHALISGTVRPLI